LSYQGPFGEKQEEKQCNAEIERSSKRCKPHNNLLR
jgi:hypothetical protein